MKESYEKDNRFFPQMNTTNVSGGVAMMTQQLARTPSVYPSVSDPQVIGTLLLSPIKELDQSSGHNTLQPGHPATKALANAFNNMSLEVTNSPVLSRILSPMTSNNDDTITTTPLSVSVVIPSNFVSSQLGQHSPAVISEIPSNAHVSSDHNVQHRTPSMKSQNSDEDNNKVDNTTGDADSVDLYPDAPKSVDVTDAIKRNNSKPTTIQLGNGNDGGKTGEVYV